MDINYVTVGCGKSSMRILKQYCKTGLENAIDVYFLITIFNRNKKYPNISGSMFEKREMVLTGCVEAIKAHCRWKGRGLNRKKLLTVCVEREITEHKSIFCHF